MKKGLTTFLVILLAVGAMLVSCKAEVATPADELVAVSFEESASRALSATLEEFDVADYFWYYAAKKTDSTGLISGQTAGYDFDPKETDTRVLNADAVSTGDEAKGLDGYKVPGFSQGTWAFTLYAYATRPTTDAEKAAWVYSGEATGVILQKNGTNKAVVTVSPNPQGNGILFVDKEHISLDEHSEASHNNVAPVITIEKISASTKPTFIPGTNAKYEAGAGTYKVTVTYTDGYITYATGDVVATVYSGLTTTVTGTVDELITYAEFDAKQNPDIITRTASSTTPVTPSTTSDVVLSDTDTETPRVTATVPAEAATNLLPEDPSASMSLALNVDTKDSSSTSVTYDISMTKTVTVSTGEVTTIDVSTVSKFVTVEIKLSANLANVNVIHRTTQMNKCTSLEQLNNDTSAVGAFYYDPAGTLYIKTKSFSPFAVSFTSAFVASMDGEKYTSLANAVNAIEDNKLHTITLLSDCSGAGIGLFKDDGDTARNIVIDLGGHTFTCSGPAVGSKGTESQAFHLEKGNTVTIKNGKITSTSGSGVSMLVQNYCNLTLEDVTLDGAGLGDSTSGYVMSNNCGNVLITGKTNITAPSGCYAFDAYYWPSNGYPEGVSITVDTTGTITGTIQLSADSKAVEPYKNSVTIKNGTFSCCSVDISKGNLLIEGGTFYGWNPENYVPKVGYCVIVEDSIYTVVPAVAKIGETFYASLPEACSAALATEGNTLITLLRDASGEGFSADGTGAGSYTIDFDGHTYDVNKCVGSSGYETQAWRVLDEQTVILKNGTLTSSVAKMLINQYGDLTLENMVLDGSNLAVSGAYTLSDNFGKTTVTGNTSIIAKEGGYAFDVWYGMSASYYDGVSVIFDDKWTGSVSGKIEYGAKPGYGATVKDWQKYAILSIGGNGTFANGVITKGASSNPSLEDATVTAGSHYSISKAADQITITKTN